MIIYIITANANIFILFEISKLYDNKTVDNYVDNPVDKYIITYGLYKPPMQNGDINTLIKGIF